MWGRLRYVVVLVLCVLVYRMWVGGEVHEDIKGEVITRVFAMGDIHGDYETAASVLIHAGIISSTHAWSGLSTTFVQTVPFLVFYYNPRAISSIAVMIHGNCTRCLKGYAQKLHWSVDV